MVNLNNPAHDVDATDPVAVADFLDGLVRPFVVNVWFGGRGDADVSERFRDRGDAIAFARKYRDYHDATVVVFCGDTEYWRLP